jgi:hypothetical protein
MNLCSDSPDTPHFLKQLCMDAKMGGEVFLIPRSYDNKITVFAPNYITESIIGILLSQTKLRLLLLMAFINGNAEHMTKIRTTIQNPEYFRIKVLIVQK